MKKKVLIFIDWYIPGFKAGGPIRSCENLVSHLSNEFDFFIVTGDTDYTDTAPYPSIKRNEWNKLKDNSSVYYISKENIGRKRFLDIIEKVDPEFILLNGIFSYNFTVRPLRIINKRKYKIFLAVRGMLAPSALRIKSFKKKIFLFVSKILRLYDGVTFIATSEEEEKQIQKHFPNIEMKMAPNLPRKVFNKVNHPAKKNGEVKFLSIARISPEKNLLYAIETLKKVNGNVRFDFYGSIYDKNYWEKCKNAMSTLPKNILMTYKGIADSNKIFDLMSNYHFLFLPTSGENFGHVILESMSAGLPVIISNETPWKNLKGKNAGWDISLNDLNKFSEIIETCVVMNESEYQILSDGSYQFASLYINDKEKIKANRELFS